MDWLIVYIGLWLCYEVSERWNILGCFWCYQVCDELKRKTCWHNYVVNLRLVEFLILKYSYLSMGSWYDIYVGMKVYMLQVLPWRYWWSLRNFASKGKIPSLLLMFGNWYFRATLQDSLFAFLCLGQLIFKVLLWKFWEIMSHVICICIWFERTDF